MSAVLDTTPINVYMMDVPHAKIHFGKPIRAESLWIVGFYAENVNSPIIKVHASGNGSHTPIGYPVTDLSDGSAIQNPVSGADFRSVVEGRVIYPDFGTTSCVLYPGDVDMQGRFKRVEPALPFLLDLNRQDLHELDIKVTGFFDEAVTFDELALQLSPVKPGLPHYFVNPNARGPNSVFSDLHGVRF
jgi:hypothetical protein